MPINVNRPILSLWPYLLGEIVPLSTVIVFAIAGIVAGQLYLVAAIVIFSLWWRRQDWLWRFARRVRHFHTITDGRVVLHHEPGLERDRDLRSLIRQCREDHDSLAKRFQFTLRRRPVVYLFRHYRDIGKLFGPEYGGAALTPATASVIADDSVVSESLRHELVHLFAARWRLAAPPLLDEGLAVWLQETSQGETIDAAARPWVCDSKLRLRTLLNRHFFFAEPHRHACYLLAGSFTGFLLRRYGWPAYRRLFRVCDRIRFSAEFEKSFGVTLEEAERQWRHELLAMSPWCQHAGSDGGRWQERFGTYFR